LKNDVAVDEAVSLVTGTDSRIRIWIQIRTQRSRIRNTGFFIRKKGDLETIFDGDEILLHLGEVDSLLLLLLTQL
jgi:hypothetical protein